MARFSKLHSLSLIKETGVVPVFYNPDLKVTENAVKACYDGGIRAFEFTNRGDRAHEIFRDLKVWAAEACPEMVIGAGTILDAPTAALYIQLGADFIVAPCLNPEVARLCNRRGVPYTPGCGTVSEISNAQELGCDLVKVFPAGCVGGASFVKNILAPLPWSMLMATGAVEPAEENLKAWAASGVTAVGMGSKLFPKDAVANGDWNRISELAAASLKWFASGKK